MQGTVICCVSEKFATLDYLFLWPRSVGPVVVVYNCTAYFDNCLVSLIHTIKITFCVHQYASSAIFLNAILLFWYCFCAEIVFCVN